MPADPFTIKQGDTKPDLVRTLVNADGSAIDLTGATVQFHMKRRGGSLKVDKAATVTDDEYGEVTVEWEADDTDEAGTFRGEFEITLTGGEIVTVPNDGDMQVNVVKQIN